MGLDGPRQHNLGFLASDAALFSRAKNDGTTLLFSALDPNQLRVACSSTLSASLIHIVHGSNRIHLGMRADCTKTGENTVLLHGIVQLLR